MFPFLSFSLPFPLSKNKLINFLKEVWGWLQIANDNTASL